MKNSISPTVWVVAILGLLLAAAIIWPRLHQHSSAAPEKSQPVAAAVPALLTTPTTPVTKKAAPSPADLSLAVIPISLTNVVIESEKYAVSTMKQLPSGVHTYGGIEFWLEGMVHLQSLHTRDVDKKDFRTSIVVPLDETNVADGKTSVTERGKNIASIYLLTAVRYAAQPREKVADVVWHYADGTTESSGLLYNVHLRDWTRMPYETPDQLPNELTKVAWHDYASGRKDRSFRLYRVALVNPHPEKTIQALEFASAMTKSSLLVAALTLDPLMPGARPDDLTSQEIADPELNGQIQILVEDTAGQPLPDAEVTTAWRSKTAGSHAKKFTTDANGLAQARYADVDLQSLDVSAEHDGFSGRKMLWDVSGGDKIPETYTLKLSDEVKIGGVVVNEKDEPIGSANVKLYRYWTGPDGSPNKKGEQPSFSNTSTTTDAAGHWEAKGLPVSLLDRIGVEVSHPDYIGDRINSVSGDAESRLRAGTYKVTLKQGLVVSGRVLDDAGNPIAGATVFGGERFYSERQHMTTDDQGGFHFARMKEGQMEFSVIAKGRSPAVQNVDVKPGMDEIVFRLGPGKDIKGIVQNAAGEPLAGTRIELEDANGGVAQSYEFSTTSGSDGRFEWDGAPDEPVHFYFAHSGYEQKRGVLLKTDTDNTVTLQKSRTIQGQVVDADTGNPITTFRVGIGRDPGNFGGTFYPDYPGMKDFTDPNGAFSLQSDEEYNSYIDAVADDYAETGQTLPAAQNDTVQVTIKLKQSPALRAVVVSPSGQPLPGVSVALVNPDSRGGNIVLSGTKITSYSQSAKISVTDDQGQCVLPSPPASGGMVVALGELGFACVSVDQVRSSPTIVLQPFGRIVGLMKSAGQPAANQGVIVTFTTPNLGSSWDAYKRTTDDQGNFTFENIPPGDVKVQRLIPTGANSWSYSDATDVTVQSGQTTQVTLGDNGATLVGHVRYEVPPTNTSQNMEGTINTQMSRPPSFNSQQEAQAYYQSPEYKALAKQSKYYAFAINSDGSFEADDIAPGTYSLNVTVHAPGNNYWMKPAIATGSAQVTVPDSFDPASPIDIGEVVLAPPGATPAPPQ